MYEFMDRNIFERSINLTDLGINNVAWRYCDISLVIDYFSNSGTVVLGGDIYYEQDGRLELSYDNWFYRPISTCFDSQESISRTIEYLDTMVQNRGVDFWVSFQVN